MAKTAVMYGAIKLRGSEIVFDGVTDVSHLLSSLPTNPKYGINWHFGGDLDLEECDIVCNDRVFDGVTAVSDLRAYLESL